MSGRLARMALGALSATDARPRWSSPYESSPDPASGPEEYAAEVRPPRPNEDEASSQASSQVSSSTTKVLDHTISPPGRMGRVREATIEPQKDEDPEEREKHAARRVTTMKSTRTRLPTPSTTVRRDAKSATPAQWGRTRERPEQLASNPAPIEHVTQDVAAARPAMPVRSSSASAEEARPLQGRGSETLPAKPVPPPLATFVQPMVRVVPRTVETARLRQTGRAAGDKARSDPTVVVTIGRLEVRAMSPRPPAPRPSSAPTPMSLDAYLTRRDQEER